MARHGSRGFTLLETLIAMSLVSISMTGLVVAIGSSSKYGTLARRQATAMTVARSQAEVLSHTAYGDPSLANSNINNDDIAGTPLTKIADPTGLFAKATIPTGNDAPDVKLAVKGGTAQGGIRDQLLVGDEPYEVFVNVSPVVDPNNAALQIGKQIAVIVRYKIGTQFMRAVAIGYRYNPAAVGVTDGLPL
jgi:prepilin-type N-terminal cleavage/methylation domain-containing protein